MRRAGMVLNGFLIVPQLVRAQLSSFGGRFFIFIVVLATLFSAPAHAFVTLEDPALSAVDMLAQQTSPQFADPFSIIVQFNNTMPVSASQAFMRSGSYAGYLAGQSSTIRTSLDTLFSTYNVNSVEALVTPPAHINNQFGGANPLYVQTRTDILNAWNAYMTEIRSTNPVRAARGYGDVAVPDLSHVYIIRFQSPQDVGVVAEKFSADSHVAYAHPNYYYRALALPNDTYIDRNADGVWEQGSWGQTYEDAWHLKMLGADRAWPTTEGASTTVAIIDTGVDYTHAELDGNIWTNPGEVPSDGIDNDLNGFVDDALGWNFAESTFDPMDTGDHGTAVAGLVAAEKNNGIGIAGVAPQTKLMALKVLSSNGSGTSDHVARAIVYAAANGADVINLSLGGAESLMRTVVDDAVQLAYAQNVVVVAAAGNDGASNKYFSPAHSLYALTVSAIDQNNTPTFFTSFGSSIDVAAPGGGINSAPESAYTYRNIISPDGLVGDGVGMDVAPGYLRAAGTSFAAPIVSGQAALLLSHRPTLTVEQVRQAIRLGAFPSGTAGWDKYTGFGRVNLDNTLLIEPHPVVRTDMLHDQDVYGTITGTVYMHPASAAFPLTGWGVWYAPENDLNNKTLITTGPVPASGATTFSFDASLLPAGTYVLMIEAVDNRGFAAEDIRRFHRKIYGNESAQRIPAPTGFNHALALGDVDADGDVDMFVGDVFGADTDVLNPTNHLYLNNGAGEFTPADAQLPANHNAVGHMFNAQFSDIDRDGDLDIVSTAMLVSEYSKLFIWINNGLGVFQDVSATRYPARTIAVPQIIERLTVDDINRDGFADILAYSAGQGLNVLKNNGSGFFSTATLSANVAWAPRATEIELADIDRDGDKDLFVSCFECSTVKYGLNDGTGSFTNTAGQSFSFGQSFELLDINQDGAEDIVIEKSGGRFFVYFNTGSGGFNLQNFGNPVVESATLSDTQMHEADIDLNGYPDIYLSTQGLVHDSAHGILINNRLGSFADRTSLYLEDDPMATQEVHFVDVSGDAFPDLVTGHFFLRPQVRIAHWQDFHYGDYDFNGSISTTETLRVLRYAVGLSIPTPSEFERADVDLDDSVTPTDALCMLQATVGKITLPCRPTETSSFIYEQNSPDGVFVTSTRRTDLGKLINFAQENGISIADLGTTTLGDLGITGKERLQFTPLEGYRIALIRGCDRLRRTKCDILVDGDEHIRVEVINTPTTPLLTLWNSEMKPLSVDAGDVVEVRAYVENIGVYADVPVEVTVFIRDFNATTVHQETISATLTKARKTLRFRNNWVASPGNYTMDVCITSSGLYDVYEPGRCMTTALVVGASARWADSAVLTASAMDGETLWLPGATTTVTWQWSGDPALVSGRMVNAEAFEEIPLFTATSSPGANTATVIIPQVAPGGYIVEICNDADVADIEQPSFVCGELPGVITIPSFAANIVVNGDFAGGKTDWASWGTNIQLVNDADAIHGNVAKIALASGMRRLLGQGPIPVVGGERYVAIAALRGEQVVGGYGHVEFEWRNAKGYVLRVDTIGNAVGTTGWSTASAVLTAPAGAEKMRVQLIAEKGSGVVYFDDVVLTSLD